ncbi:unnamed protein product [Symbiodinium sp. CCMP2592]|nr:unnamed protein product [Symbiodinium sp. CCMP2592]
MAEEPPRKRRGGVRQRQQAAREEEVQTKSHLAKILLERWCRGEISPQQVQTLAHAALKDMKQVSPESSMPELENLAKLGDYGHCPNNCNKELLALVEPKVKFPQPYHQQVPFKQPLYDQDQAFFLPHEIFSKMYTEYPQQFKASLVPSDQHLEDFWSQMQHNPRWEGHELRSRADFRHKAVPLGLHGDDVPVVGIGKGWSSKMSIFSMFSLVAVKQPTREKMLLLYSVFERIRVREAGRNTLYSFFRLLVWSLYWLFQGVWPRTDPQGKQFLASEVRHLGRALSRVFDAKMNDALQIHRDISRMLHYNIQMEDILEENKEMYALPEDAANRFARCCDAMLLLQERVARHFATDVMTKMARKYRICMHLKFSEAADTD